MIKKIIYKIRLYFSPALRHYELGKAFVEESRKCEVLVNDKINKAEIRVSLFELDLGEVISVNSIKYSVDSIDIISTNKHKAIYFYKLKEVVEIERGN